MVKHCERQSKLQDYLKVPVKVAKAYWSSNQSKYPNIAQVVVSILMNNNFLYLE